MQREVLNPLNDEFDRQVENLIDKGYPALAGVTAAAFIQQLAPLKKHLTQLHINEQPADDYLPLVVVIQGAWVAPEKAMQAVNRRGKPGTIKMYPRTPADFSPRDAVAIPPDRAYLLIGVDRGSDTRNIAPSQALKTLAAQDRSPLTIDEGIAIVTHFPEFLKKNHCFSLLASRCGDKRVPALWLSDNMPKLGWCWDGNPHTWLGSASCQARLGGK